MSASTSTVVGATPLCICPPAFTEGKHDGTIYTCGNSKFFAILDSYELLDTVLGPNGIDPEPIATIESTNPSAVIPSDATLLRAWRRRNADALCVIIMCVTDSTLTLVQHTTKAHKAWNILACQYEAHNHTRIQNLENQLAAEKLVDGEKVEAFIKWIKDLQDQLATIGVTISHLK
ncbi:hypothetical protein L7F22_047234 [Adiantum nelumboides]|nr:hypothetical protein [Adiantum nelumboides]